jgi:tetratricopeptide (TPR) repeat protein
MAISSEIEKLERRWHENPAGLMFAPLAEAYRKAGNYQRALEVLEVGLAVHADYVPALIVRGRCHLDGSDLAASETAFQQVLACDPANPIALRSLADLYERSGRVDEAMERLTLLVEVDRGDGEARASLERLRQPPAPLSPPALSLVAEPIEPAPLPELASPEPIPEPIVVEDRPVADATAAESFGIEHLSVDPMASAEPHQPFELPPWERMTVPEWQEPEPAVEPTSALEPPPVLEPVVAGPITWTPARWESFAAEPEPLEAPAEAPVEAAITAEVVTAEVVVETDVPEVVPEAVETVAVTVVAEPPVAEEPLADAVAEEPALIVTESMAELFLKQGHRELSLAVYRQLAEREPGDSHLLEAISRLESELAPPAAAPAFLPEPGRHAAAVTGGLSVEQYLQAALHSPPPATASTVLPPAIEPGPAGEPTRAIDQSLSLGAVFGDETSGLFRTGEDEPSSVVQPAEPSYDEFFGAVPAAETAAFGGGAGESSEVEDLRQFNEWLKGLKR